MKRFINKIFIFIIGCKTMTNNDFHEGFIKNNDVKIYYKSFGQGDPIIIVHGGPGFDHVHMLPFKELSDKYQVIFYDQRATGESSGDTDSASITVGNFVSDLELIRKDLGLDKISLIGHSWGARLSMEYAIKYSANLEKLILLSPSSNMDYMNQYVENIEKKTDEESRLMLKKIEESSSFKSKEQKTIEKYYSIATKPFFHDTAKISKLDLSMHKNTANNQSVVADLLMREVMTRNINSELYKVHCLTLILHGESDPMPIKAASQVYKSIQNSKMVVLKNTGHFMFAETPTQTLSIIRKFLDESNNK